MRIALRATRNIRAEEEFLVNFESQFEPYNSPQQGIDRSPSCNRYVQQVVPRRTCSQRFSARWSIETNFNRSISRRTAYNSDDEEVVYNSNSDSESRQQQQLQGLIRRQQQQQKEELTNSERSRSEEHTLEESVHFRDDLTDYRGQLTFADNASEAALLAQRDNDETETQSTTRNSNDDGVVGTLSESTLLDSGSEASKDQDHNIFQLTSTSSDHDEEATQH